MIHRLSDGRNLAYAEYGVPHGAPVFFFHGSPGSRLFRPPDEVTQRLGVHLICVDRPGYGGSAFQANRRLLDWPNDIAALADALELDSFAVCGHSGGGPHALACAYALPKRVRAAAVLSGAGPINSPGATKGMTFLNSLAFRFGQYIPWTGICLMVGRVFREQAANPSTAIDHDKESRPAPDNEILDIPEIREICMQSDQEAYSQGTIGLAQDIYLITRPWGFALEEIKIRVQLWHGTADNSTSLAMARYMAAKIPNSNLSICNGEGHMLLINHWEEILTALLQSTPADAEERNHVLVSN